MNTTLQAEELESFDRPVCEFPQEVERKQARAFMRQLRTRYGTIGLVRLPSRRMVERRRLKRRAGSTLRRLEAGSGNGIPAEWNAELTR